MQQRSAEKKRRMNFYVRELCTVVCVRVSCELLPAFLHVCVCVCGGGISSEREMCVVSHLSCACARAQATEEPCSLRSHLDLHRSKECFVKTGSLVNVVIVRDAPVRLTGDLNWDVFWETGSDP